MRKRWYVFIALTVTFTPSALLFASEASKDVRQTTSSGASTVTEYSLTPMERSQLEISAKDGSSSASFRLYQYYNLTLHDEQNSMAWLQRAADQGSTVAKYSVAYFRIWRDGRTDPETEELLNTVERAAQDAQHKSMLRGIKHTRTKLEEERKKKK